MHHFPSVTFVLKIGSNCNSTRTFVVNDSCFTYRHKLDDFKQAFNSFAGVDLGVTGKVCLKSPANITMHHQKIDDLIVRSLSVRSSASNDRLCAIVHPSRMNFSHYSSTLAIADISEILQVGSSLICTFKGNLSAELAVRPPSNNVAAIREDANVDAIPSAARILAKIKLMTSV